MKLNKSITGLVSSIALLGVLVGCGGNESSQSSSTMPEKPSNVTVTFWHTFGDTAENYLERVANEFSELVLEHDGVNVTIEADYRGNYDDIEGIVIKGFSTGNYPDICVAYPDNVANYLYQREEVVVNLDEWMEDEEVGFGAQEWLGDISGSQVYDKSDFIEAFIDESSLYQQEGSYSLPFMKSSEVMFYNKGAFELACDLYQPEGVADTEGARQEWLESLSWDEFVEFGRFIKEHAEQILSPLAEDDGYPIYYDSDSNLFITKMAQNDIPYSSIGENGMGIIGFESGDYRTEAEGIISDLASLHQEGVFTTKALEGEYGSNAFTEQRALFSIGSSGGTGYNIPTSDAFEVGICCVPCDNDNPLYVNQGPTLTLFDTSVTGTDDPWRTYYAWEFMKYITNPDVNSRMCVHGSEGYVPVRYSAYETQTYQTFLQNDPNDPFVLTSNILQNDINGNYIVTPVFVGSAELRDQVGTILNTVVTQGYTVTQAFSEAINNAKQLFH